MLSLKKLTRTQLLDELSRFAKSRPPGKRKLVAEVIGLACEIHDGQPDRFDGTVTIHVLRMAVRCIRFGYTDTWLITAVLLHKAIEERLDIFLKKFGSYSKGDSVALSRKKAYQVIADEYGEIAARTVSEIVAPDDTYFESPIPNAELHSDFILSVFQDKSLWRAKVALLSSICENALDMVVAPNAHRVYLSMRYLPVFAEVESQLPELIHQPELLETVAREFASAEASAELYINGL